MDAPDRGQTARVEALLRPALGSDETLLWLGRSRPWSAIRQFRFLWIAFVMVPFFGLMFLGLRDSDGVGKLFLTIMTLGGLWLVSEPLRVFVRARCLMIAVTSRRVLFVGARSGQIVREVPGSALRDVWLRTLRDGTGHITLIKPLRLLRFSADRRTLIEGLWGVVDAAGAARAVRSLRDSARLAAR